ncbi:MAG TPA: HAMP domain-containing sensor histidine kinase, partial [Jatrophihabitantaceae bacterium]
MTLAGSSPYIVGLGGRAAVALGTLMVLLMVLPASSSPGRLLIALTGAGALVIGIVLLRLREHIALAPLDVALVLGDGLLVFLGRYDGPLAPAFPGIYLVIGTIIFAGRSWWVVAGHVALLGASYAGVLAVGPHHFAPVSRWVIVMTVLVITGIFLRWLVLVVAGLARGERDARAAAERAAAELEQVGRAKNVFLARMSHELRTPLNVILGFADLLSEQRVGPLNARQQEYVGDVGDSARHLVALVDDVLDLATVSSGGVRLNSVLFDVWHVIEDSVTLVRDQAARKGLVIEVDVAAEVGAIEADRVKVRQVVVNLLANAVKFTPSGGQVAVRARAAGNRVHISVSDTGIGIAPQDLDRIFEEFAQSDRGQEGTGLGLTLARRFVELHGGRLEVVSTPGQGSRFSFELPRHARRGAPVDMVPFTDAGLSDHSAFTRPGSAANRTLITRIASRLLVVCGLLSAVVAAITPGDDEKRIAIAASGVGVAVLAWWVGARLPRPSFKQIEWAGWAAVLGISVVTYFTV